MRKQIFRFLSIVFACVIVNLGAYVTVYADSECFDSMKSLYNHWQEIGYPEDVGGVYLSNEKYVVLLVNMDASRVDELEKSLSDPSDVEFESCKYPYNELKTLCSQLDNHIWSSDDIYSLGVDVKGNCVNVGVDSAAVSKYKSEYTAIYGDKINIVAEEQNVADKQPFNIWPCIGICVATVVIVFVVLLCLRKDI